MHKTSLRVVKPFPPFPFSFFLKGRLTYGTEDSASLPAARARPLVWQTASAKRSVAMEIMAVVTPGRVAAATGLGETLNRA